MTGIAGSANPGGGNANPGGGSANPGGGTGNMPGAGGAPVGAGGDTVISVAGTGSGGAPMVVKMSCASATADPLPYTGGYKADPAIRSAAMTLANTLSNDERAQQMRGLPQTGAANYNVFRQEDNTARGIKAFLYRDGPRGVNLPANGDSKNDFSTAFPVAIARGAAFDVDLEYHIGQDIGDETLVSGNTMILAPTVNILRHPAWGRAQETYGEDPFLLGRLGSAFVVGAQEYIAACVKHYAANNTENGRGKANATMDEQTLREIYARHFEMIVKEGGVSSIMAAYNQVNGSYSTQNKHLLTDLLRTAAPLGMGFQGFVLTDWWAMPNGNMVPLPNPPTALQTTAGEAIGAGLDQELPWSYNYSTIPTLISAMQVSSAQLVTSTARILEQKMRFKVDKLTGPIGLKTPTTTYNTGTASIENNQAHIDHATQAAKESMVLLKNEGNVLPINRTTVKSIAVIGANVSYPNVTVKSQDGGTTLDFTTNVRTGDLGSSRVFADPAKSVGPFAGIQAAAGAGITVTRGNTAAAAANADFVVVIAGLTPLDEGEEYTGAGDRSTFALDGKANAGVQNALIAAVAALKKPMVVVLEGGATIDMPWLASVPAVVMAWYPGMTGGKALGDLLMGTSNFSGKLPFSWAAFVDEPTFIGPNNVTAMDYYIGYRYFDKNNKKPQFPFGFGLSYTTFAYSNLQVPCSDVPKDGVVNVSVDVANTGTKAGDEVVFLFVSYPSAGTVRRPIKELKGFTRVSLAAPDPANPANGSAKRVTIPLRVADLKYWDTAGAKWDVQTGPVQVMVGTSSDKLTLMDTFTVK